MLLLPVLLYETLMILHHARGGLLFGVSNAVLFPQQQVGLTVNREHCQPCKVEMAIGNAMSGLAVNIDAK